MDVGSFRFLVALWFNSWLNNFVTTQPQECKRCGLLKSTVDSLATENKWYSCVASEKHDFGEDISYVSPRVQPPEEGWEKEFDDKFPPGYFFRGSDRNPIKAFIRSTREAAVREERAKIIKENFKGEHNRILYMIRIEKQIISQKIDLVIAEEINIARTDGFPTSRLTALMVKLRGILKDYNY